MVLVGTVETVAAEAVVVVAPVVVVGGVDGVGNVLVGGSGIGIGKTGGARQDPAVKL